MSLVIISCNWKKRERETSKRIDKSCIFSADSPFWRTLKSQFHDLARSTYPSIISYRENKRWGIFKQVISINPSRSRLKYPPQQSPFPSAPFPSQDSLFLVESPARFFILPFTNEHNFQRKMILSQRFPKFRISSATSTWSAEDRDRSSTIVRPFSPRYSANFGTN